MKKIFSIIAFMSMAMLVSCNDAQSKAESTAKSFLEANANADFAEAKKYCDANAAMMIGMLEGMIDAAKKEEIKSKDIKINIISTEVKDNTAVVKYKVVSKGSPETSEKQLDLIKEGEDWKVTLGNKTPNGSTAPTAPAPSAEAPATAPAQ
ncbi:DUF4878 domain-containing protein [Flavobacterium zepuense]|uniref:DUF4878 domain-containing protein n=1 Tax=Flavobacterium zepuense TaxID=2593302 RepID=A0A552V7Z3_9FLAO|nr:DUF4878 domain-containing protein [Flavobacterium zepuense]TRW26568.1 DUF4878 domain-containing protein [Flavobacterium zepuense]